MKGLQLINQSEFHEPNLHRSRKEAEEMIREASSTDKHYQTLDPRNSLPLQGSFGYDMTVQIN